MASGAPDLTVDEVLSLLQRTSLPTIVVEGRDDMIVYRRMEERLEGLGVSVLPVGGRSKVLQIFERRSEIPRNVQCAYVVDCDTWIYSGIPAPYKDGCLILTSGYSIENDVFVDGDLQRLLTPTERLEFQRDLQRFIHWYALELSRALSDDSGEISLHPSNVLDAARYPVLTALRPSEPYPDSLRTEIEANFQRLLRGKSLMALLVSKLSHSRRVPKHSHKALLESVAVTPGHNLERIQRELAAHFA